ncbi:MAG: hypothetical protein QOH40_1646, partial [Arthrobacter pascens]|nr:hypothetical protein [Arthrobacter pascens]
MWRLARLVGRGMEANSRRSATTEPCGEDRRRNWEPTGVGDADRPSAAGRLQLYAGLARRFRRS